MIKKIIAGAGVLITLATSPAFADWGDQPVYIRMNNGTVRTVKLERAERMQARGQGVIIGSPAPIQPSVGTYWYPNNNSTYYYQQRTTTTNNGYYPYSSSSTYVYPNNGTYVYPNGTYWNPNWAIPDTRGAGHPHQHQNNNYGW